jgi:hypothetical protein
MSGFRHLFVILLLISTAHAGNPQNYYRTFWRPAYHGQRLDYCMAEGKACGLPVAHHYCQLMGYEKADQESIDYNVGKTTSFTSCVPCKGWPCNGFTLIRCVSKFTHKPASTYYYRSHKFVFPRYNHARVDWCYKDGKGCGQRAATSFCRRMGYERVKRFEIQRHVSQTQAISNHRVCLGDRCNGFGYITCYR